MTIYLGEFVTIYIFSDAAGEDGGAHGGDGGAHGGDEGNPYLKTMYMYAVTRCSFNRTFAFFAQGWCKRRRRCHIVCLDFGGSLAFHSNFPRNLSISTLRHFTRFHYWQKLLLAPMSTLTRRMRTLATVPSTLICFGFRGSTGIPFSLECM